MRAPGLPVERDAFATPEKVFWGKEETGGREKREREKGVGNERADGFQVVIRDLVNKQWSWVRKTRIICGGNNCCDMKRKL